MGGWILLLDFLRWVLLQLRHGPAHTGFYSGMPRLTKEGIREKLMDRPRAWALVNEHLKTPHIVKHVIAVEAAMRAIAARVGADVELWGLAGLLHDLDYEYTADTPAKHGEVTAEILSAVDINSEVVGAILAHNHRRPAETPIDHGLLAADPATGLIVAAALMTPGKTLAACNVDFLLKRFKEKRFAAGANREQIAGCEALGLELREFLGLCLEGMRARSSELGL